MESRVIAATLSLLGGLALQTCMTHSAYAQLVEPNIPPLTLRVRTQLVLVDVVVRDKKGRPVENLTPADFLLFEDGRAVKIATFSREQLTAQNSVVRSGPPSLPAGVYTNRPEYQSGPTQRAVVLLDGLNTLAQDQSYARLQLLRYLARQLNSNEQIAVFALDGSLQVLQDFTDDPSLLRTAVENFTPKTSRELLIEDLSHRLPPPSRQLAETPQLLAARTARVSALYEFYSDQAELAVGARIRATLHAFETIARLLAGYPGRKNLIWVSASFPLGVLRTTSGSAYVNELNYVYQLLNDAQVAIYPVDARGLVGAVVFDASSPGTTEAGLLPSGPEFADMIKSKHDLLANTQATMEELAHETGGLAFTNRNDLDQAVRLSLDDGASYYLLGFYRGDKPWDGMFHKLQVKVNRPGLEVRHRMGYFALDPVEARKHGEGDTNKDLEWALRFDSPVAPMIVFDVRVAPHDEGKFIDIPIDILVDPATLSSEDSSSGGRHFKLSYHIAAFNSFGSLAAHKDVAVDAPLSAEEYSRITREGLPLQARLEVPSGQYSLRIVVRDLRTGFLGSVNVRVLPE